MKIFRARTQVDLGGDQFCQADGSGLVWISCDCSPLISNTSRHNRNETGARNRGELGQYFGAVDAAEVAFRSRTQVHWELSQPCKAWKLPEIEGKL